MNVSDFKRKSVILFILSIMFLILNLVAFNYELDFKSNFITHNLKNNINYKIKITEPNVKSIRILIYKGSSKKLVNFNLPLNISISNGSGEKESYLLSPKGASTGGSRRYYGILNYGIVALPAGRNFEIGVSISNEIHKFEKFELHIKGNPSNFYIYLFGVIFLVLLLASIKFREFIFKGKYLRVTPYILYLFIAILVLSWNI